MNYNEFYRKSAGKVVKVVMNDDESFEGKLIGFISAADNDPEPESIIVGNIELYTNEIKSCIVSA